MNTLEELLNNRWILKSEDKEKYYRVKDDTSKYKRLFQEKLGYRLLINPYLIKLEKLPGKAEPFMGIQDFTSTLEYSMLCVVLMFLEDKSAEEQFVLSELTEYLQVNHTPEKLEWTVYNNRKSLIKVIKFCLKNNLMKATDGEEEQFARDADTEVLFEVTGISRYFVRSFTRDIMGYSSLSDFEKSEYINVDEDRGQVRRHRVYRKLLLSIGMYKSFDEDEDFIYLRNFRNTIEKDMSEEFNCDLHIHKTSAYLVAREDATMGRSFPENSNLSDIILLLNQQIQEDIASGLLQLSPDESLHLTREDLKRLIESCKQRHGENWGKTYKDKTNQELINECLTYMTGLGFAEESDQQIKLQPIIGKLTGKYTG